MRTLWLCRATSSWGGTFGDYVWAPTRVEAAAAFFCRHGIQPFQIVKEDR